MNDFKNMSFYISGPMSNLPENNFPAFVEAEENLVLNYPKTNFINPAKVEQTFVGQRRSLSYSDLLDFDIELIERFADALLLLPGWKKSNGCIEEIKAAIHKGLRIYHYCDGKILERSKK